MCSEFARQEEMIERSMTASSGCPQVLTYVYVFRETHFLDNMDTGVLMGKLCILCLIVHRGDLLYQI